MPKYEYRCSDCGTIVTASRSVTEPDTAAGSDCYWCEHGVLKRIFSPAPVQFKGKGFYKTDSA